MKNSVFILLLLVVGVLSGCSSAPAHFKSPANFADLDFTQERQLSAKACGFHLFNLIPIRMNSRMERARRSVAKKANGDALVNIQLEESWAWYIVGNNYCSQVKATAVPET